MRRIFWIALAVAVIAAIVAAPIGARADGPKVGSPAPKIEANVLRGPRIAADLGKLKGNVVVIEFWATWCGPCMAAIPHLNEIADRYRDRPVTFLSISVDQGGDAEVKIRNTMQKRPFKTWVLHALGGTQKRYGVTGIPTTFLIDRAGRLDAITYPTNVTETVLDRLLASKPSGVVSAPVAVQTESVATSNPPIFRFTIRKVLHSRGSLTKNFHNELSAEGLNMRELIAWAYGVSPTRVIRDDPWPAGEWALDATFPPSLEKEMARFVKDLTPANLGVTVEPTQRTTMVCVLRCPNGPKGSLKSYTLPGGSHESTSEGFLAAVNAPISSLANMLEGSLGSIVLDETGLRGSYEWTIHFKEGDRSSLLDALRECGIEVVTEPRKIEVLLIKKIAP